MTVITRVAFIELCECTEHGRFRLRSGDRSAEFCSKQGALEELTRLRDEGAVDADEVLFLKSAIPADWPRLNEDADLSALLTCKINNSIREEKMILGEEDSRADICGSVM